MSMSCPLLSTRTIPQRKIAFYETKKRERERERKKGEPQPGTKKGGRRQNSRNISQGEKTTQATEQQINKKLSVQSNSQKKRVRKKRKKGVGGRGRIQSGGGGGSWCVG